ncbi:MAG: DMT family transporter [Burkholderiales bacterium]
MYHVLSVLAGIIVAVMVAVNGKLSSYSGVYSSTVVIHIVGLLTVLLLLAIRRERVFSVKRQPLYMYLGGAIGVASVVFSNIAFGSISVSAIIALSLLGQSLTSLVYDRWGLCGMPKREFHKMKLIGIAFVVLGIAAMLYGSEAQAVIPIAMSLLIGVSTVMSRTVNALLAQRTSVLVSALFNYIVGLAVSAAALLVAGRAEPMMQKFSLSPDVWIYTGGILGLFIVVALNAAVCRISSFYMTLLLFVGQVFSGIAVDIVLTGSFSVNNLVGGLCITAGLAQNLWVDKRLERVPCPDA